MASTTYVPGKRAQGQGAKLPRLRVLFDGGGAGPAVDLEVHVLDGLRVGREVSGENALTLAADVALSRHHATFNLRGDILSVVDSSTNGTFVNGVRVADKALQDGDVLRLGDTLFLLRLSGAAAGAASAPTHGLLGQSREIQKLRALIALMAPTASTVLLLGETGTGKELAARAIHAASGRPGPFLALNCAAIPETLAESQLFGHVAGAFTGARGAEAGAFRHAQGGTLFLDELGELPAPVQAKLLRALENQEVLPLGATTPVHVDARVICATHLDLVRRARDGAFRPDLYARIAELVIKLPPLRERREDILPLLTSFLPADAPPLSPDLAERLLLHPFPFNVRELKKIAAELSLQRGLSVLDVELIEERLADAAVLLETDPLVEDAPKKRAADRSAAADQPAVERDVRPPSKDELDGLLRAHGGNMLRLSKVVGRSRRQIYRWMDQHGLRIEDYRSGSSDVDK